MARTAWAIAAVTILAQPVDTAAQEGKQKPPYFASLSPTKARMRTGPGRSYPATWLYVRPDLPIKVVDIYKEWRKIEDPGGTQGWMLGNLVSSQRTGIVTGQNADLHAAPQFGGKVVWRAAPGVVGRLSQCKAGWCRFDVKGQAGFVEASRLWGVASDEVLP